MTDPLNVRDGEAGLYRLFAIDLPATEVAQFTTSVPSVTGQPDYPLRDALGLDTLDEHHVQILDLKELSTLGIATYLTDGLAISETQFKTDLPMLEALEGYLAVIASAAFAQPVKLAPKAPLRLVATYGEDKPHKPLIDLNTPSAEGIMGGTKDISRPAAGWPKWVTVLILLACLALGYGLYALITSGDTP